MATKKQLAALKKGREALAKKRAGKKPVKKAVKKTVKKTRRKNPAKRATEYAVKMVWKNKHVYYVKPGVYETDKDKAKGYKSLPSATKKARELFNSFKVSPALESVSIVKK